VGRQGPCGRGRAGSHSGLVAEPATGGGLEKKQRFSARQKTGVSLLRKREKAGTRAGPAGGRADGPYREVAAQKSYFLCCQGWQGG